MNAGPPPLEAIDHIHVFVADRAAAEAWYARVLDLQRVAALAQWASDRGPLTIANRSGTIHLALFERPTETCRCTIAFRASAKAFLDWRNHLGKVLNGAIAVEDHAISWSLYFADPDGNPYEITSYDYAEIASLLRSAD